jgi:hypothetical protein
MIQTPFFESRETPMKSSDNLLTIEKGSLSRHHNAVIVETNRWKPDRCMWTVKKEEVAVSNIQVFFPFPEVWASICHIIIGTSEDYYCYIHLTPLTSLFRTYTAELEKIMLNLDLATGKGKKKDWKFQVFYLIDDDREEKFRSLLAKVLGKTSVTFTPLIIREDLQDEFNLVYGSGRWYYSTQKTGLLSYKDCSDKGFFNEVRIEAIE